MRVPLVGSSYQGVSVALDSQRSMNMMEEFADSKDAAAPSALIATGGLTKLFNSTGAAISFAGYPVRGIFPINAVGFFTYSILVIAASTLYRLDPNNTFFFQTESLTYDKVTVGTIESESVVHVNVDPISIIFAIGSTQIVFTGSQGVAYVYTIASGALSAAIVFDGTPGNYFGIADVVFLAGYFIAWGNFISAGAQRRIFYSTLNDGSLWAALDFFTVEETASPIRKLMVKNGQLWVFTDDLLLRFAPTGDANNPFAPIAGSAIDHGCHKDRTVCELNESFYWLGMDRSRSGFIIYRTRGGAAERVSNGFVESRIQSIFDQFGLMGIDDCTAYSSIERGHPFYKIHFHRGKTTLVYDELTNKWHERGWWNPVSGEYEEEIGWIYAAANGRHLVGDRRMDLDEGVTGIYQLSERLASNVVFYQNTAAHTAGTDTFIRRERISPIFSGPNGERLFCNGLELIFETGTADANGQGSDPKVTLYVSNDGGNTWGTPRIRSIGKTGKFKDRCTFNSLGSAYKMVFKLVMTDPIAWKLVSAVANLDLGR